MVFVTLVLKELINDYYESITLDMYLSIGKLIMAYYIVVII